MALFEGNVENLRSLYTNQLRSLLSTEEQIAKALPKMVEAATDAQLKKALQTHNEETKRQAQRLKTILQNMTGDTDEKKCGVTAALISAGEAEIKAAKDDAVRDAGIIASAQKIEHFEVASYGTARAWARQLGDTQNAELLEQSMQEEKHADQLLSGIAERRNLEAEKAA